MTSNRLLFTVTIIYFCFLGFDQSGHISAQSSNFFYYRTYDGTYNDLLAPRKGSTHRPFSRMQQEAQYIDGQEMMIRENARTISNRVSGQELSQPNSAEMSAMMVNFLQFVDHDIILTSANGEHADIQVPIGDPFFDPFFTGEITIPFTRTDKIAGSTPRNHENLITSWLDASNIYGSDQDRAHWLRSGECGKMKVSGSDFGYLLPCNTVTGDCDDEIDPNAPEMFGNKDRMGIPQLVFVAGDARANEQPGLTALHTLFVREHNRICDELIANGQCFDEKNYQYARKIVGAIIQSIVYNELLPKLGINLLNDQYIREKSPDIMHSFATAAFRLGHTMVSDELYLYDSECGELTTKHSLSEVFFNPDFVRTKGITSLLLGMKYQPAEEIDLKVVNSLRNFLFGPPGAGGLDLVALNIQRGRDHGIPDYNTLREIFGLDVIHEFTEITSNPELAADLNVLYENVDNIDAWVGILAEDHMPGKSTGETIHRILSEQFDLLRQADRFYYTRDFLLRKSEIKAITNTRLSDVIKRNTGIELMVNVFSISDCKDNEDELIYCSNQGLSTSYEWINLVSINGQSHSSGDDSGYGNFVNQIFEIPIGENLDLFFSPGYARYSYKEHWNVWIDFDNDGSFDSHDHIFHSRQHNNVKAQVVLPQNLDPGKRRMRVSMSYFGQEDPCGLMEYGEVEDYTIDFTESSLASSRSGYRENKNISVITKSIDLFPNPANEYTVIRYSSDSEGTGVIQLYDLTGKKIMERSVSINKGDNRYNLSIAELPSGMHSLLLIDSHGNRNRTMLVKTIR